MTGFMLPIDEVENIKEFLLVQSLWSCCYGQPPDINGIVRVVMPKGKTDRLLLRPAEDRRHLQGRGDDDGRLLRRHLPAARREPRGHQVEVRLAAPAPSDHEEPVRGVAWSAGGTGL
jgi:hypothetical protein